MENSGGFRRVPGLHSGLVGSWIRNAHWVTDPNNPTDAEKQRAEAESAEAVAALLLIRGSNRAKFGELKRDLANVYLKGDDRYPDTIEEARNHLQNYEPTARPSTCLQFQHNEGVAMA